MKTISGGLQTHLDGRVTSLATLWKITRADATVLGFTDHVLDITYNDGGGSVTYEAKTGYTRSAIASNSDLSVDNVDIEGYVDSVKILDSDIRAGKYDYAQVSIMMVNYESLGDGHISLRKGRLGEIKLHDKTYIAEIRGLAQHLSIQFVEVYTPSCRADLGDTRCKVSLGPFTFTGTVTSVTNRRVFAATVSTPQADGYFIGGLLTWTSGNNNTYKMEVKEYASSTNFTLFLQMPYDIQVGDTFSVIAGCDKLFATCKDKFNNVVNFRGEPHVPGTDTLAKYPDAKA